MATRRTTLIRPSGAGLRAQVVLTALTLATLGGLALWLVRPSGEVTPSHAPAVTAVATETALTVGGPAEQHLAAQQTLAAPAAARATTQGGLAELYREQEREARANIELDSRMGGMAELYRAAAAQP
jgi:hypothetical protein